MMNIYGYLKKDHKKVSLLFKTIINTSSQKKREQLFMQVKEELLLHADTEHKTFYKALAKHAETKEDVTHGDKEHKEIKKILTKLSKIPSKETVKWLVQFGELKRIVDHHVKEEEDEMFARAKKVLSDTQAKELAIDMDKLKLRKRKTT